MNTSRFESRVSVESKGELSADALKVIAKSHGFNAAEGVLEDRVVLVGDAPSYRVINTHAVRLCRELRKNGYVIHPADIKSVGVVGAV